MMHGRWLPACLIALLAGVAHAQAPSAASLTGVVRDSTGRAVPAVEIRLDALALRTRTDDSGAFRFSGLPAGRHAILARRMGFIPDSGTIMLHAGRHASIVIRLRQLATTLDGVLVLDDYDARSRRLLSGFWHRRDIGQGHYFTRDEIEERDPHSFVDLLRAVPGVRVSSGSGVRFYRDAGRADCPPQFVVDGVRIENGSPEEFSPTDLEAVEVYAGAATTPPEFAPRFRTRTCGVIVIWTRIPG